MKKSNIISFAKIFFSFFIFPIAYLIFWFLFGKIIGLIEFIMYNWDWFVDDGLTPPREISTIIYNNYIDTWLTGILWWIIEVFLWKPVITALIMAILSGSVLYFKKTKFSLYTAHIIFIWYILYHFNSDYFVGM